MYALLCTCSWNHVLIAYTLMQCRTIYTVRERERERREGSGRVGEGEEREREKEVGGGRRGKGERSGEEWALSEWWLIL